MRNFVENKTEIMRHVVKMQYISLLLEYINLISRGVFQHEFEYSHAPHNDVSVNDGPHIRRWSHNIIVPLCYNCLQYSVQ
jgi:hypothetical protein